MNPSDAIQELRAATSMTQAAFADRLEVGLATVKRWETGQFEPNHGGMVCLLMLASEIGRKDLIDFFTAQLGTPGPLRPGEVLSQVSHLLKGLEQIVDRALGDLGHVKKSLATCQRVIANGLQQAGPDPDDVGEQVE